MTDREKLIDMIVRTPSVAVSSRAAAEHIADHLIAGGVVFVTDNNVGCKWIPVTERLPRKEEYTAMAEDGTEYYVRLLIAYATDTVEYEIGYYDGCKWMTEMPIRLIKDVIAWMPFPEMPKSLKGVE